MTKFKNKRESLELFVKEQLIGPGALNKRYFFLSKWEKNEFFGTDLKSKDIKAINNKSEIITEVPAYQYSSAILFPETTIIKDVKDSSIPKEDDGQIPDLEDSEHGADDENIVGNTSESLISKQQNYPNSVGLSFVIDKYSDLQEDLIIKTSFRKYINLNKKESLINKLSCLVSDYENEIEIAIANYFNPLFTTLRKDKNLFIFLNDEINKNNIYDIDYIHLNNYLQNHLLKTIKAIFGDSLVEVKKDTKATYFGIRDENELQFYSIIDSVTYGGIEYKNVASLYDNNICFFLKTKLQEDLSNYTLYKSLIREIEIFNQLKNYVTDLKSVYKPRNASPVWESNSYEDIMIHLPRFDNGNKILRFNDLSVNSDIKELSDLKYSVQYILRNDEIFIKIILLNKASN